LHGPSGGRSWRAHRVSTRINIELTFPPEKAEDYLHCLESVCLLASVQPLRRDTCWWSLDVANSLRTSHRVFEALGTVWAHLCLREGEGQCVAWHRPR